MQGTILVLEHKEYRLLYGQINFYFSESTILSLLSGYFLLDTEKLSMFRRIHSVKVFLSSTCPDMY
jgi:hypothetical protein